MAIFVDVKFSIYVSLNSHYFNISRVIKVNIIELLSCNIY